MEWTQFWILIATIASLFFWSRSEANSDRSEANSDRKDRMNLINSDKRDVMNLINSIHAEIKDFHARLCVIEERKKEIKTNKKE